MTRLMTKEQENLVLENQKFVNYLVKKLQISLNDYDDMVSIGTIGLIKAAITFDESKKAQFPTYAYKCITNEFNMHFRRQKIHFLPCFSLEKPIFNNGEDNEITLNDMIASKDFTEDLFAKGECARAISIILNLLNPRERLIMLYKIAGTTQEFIAKALDLSQPSVSRLISESTNKIKKYLDSTIQFEQSFSISIIDDLCKISLNSENILRFEELYSLFVQTSTCSSSFMLNCNSNQIIVQIPVQPESFSLLAQVFKEFDVYCI